MTVIPLVKEVKDGHGPTVVDTVSIFDATGTAVPIQHLDEKQLKDDSKTSNVCYDLRIGPKFRDHREAHVRDLGDNGEIVLLPGMAVIIQTEEEVHFPNNCFGLIMPRVSLLWG